MLSTIITLTLLAVIIVGIGLFFGAFILKLILQLLGIKKVTYKKTLKIQLAIWLISLIVLMILGNGLTHGLPIFLGSVSATGIITFFYIALLLKRYFKLDLGSSIIIYIIYASLYIIVFFGSLYPFHKYIGQFDMLVNTSMEPTFNDRSILFTDYLHYKTNNPERGDIIKFYNPDRDNTFVGRIVGIPGETIKIENGKVIVCKYSNSKHNASECKNITENYLPQETYTTNSCQYGRSNEYNLISGYFVLSDNRDHDSDSRCCFGLECQLWHDYEVLTEDIIGKISFEIYPYFKLH